MTVTEKLRRRSANVNWYYKHEEGLRKSPVYRDRYVAVDRGRILAAGTSFPDVVERLYSEHPGKADAAYVEFVSSTPCAQIL